MQGNFLKYSYTIYLNRIIFQQSFVFYFLELKFCVKSDLLPLNTSRAKRIRVDCVGWFGDRDIHFHYLIILKKKLPLESLNYFYFIVRALNIFVSHFCHHKIYVSPIMPIRVQNLASYSGTRTVNLSNQIFLSNYKFCN